MKNILLEGGKVPTALVRVPEMLEVTAQPNNIFPKAKAFQYSLAPMKIGAFLFIISLIYHFLDVVLALMLKFHAS